MKNKPLFWLAKQMKRRIPAILVLTAADVGSALFGVFFALGSRGVIDSAVSGDPLAFRDACLYQAGIIAMILVCLTVKRHLSDRLRADLGIPQQLQCPIRKHPDYPVEHIFHPKAGKEDHISHLDGPGGQVQIDRVAGVEKGGHAGARHGDGDVGVALVQKVADGVEIGGGVEDLWHGGPPFLFVIIA